MSSRFADLLKRDISLFPKRRQPSPLARKISRILGLFCLVLVGVFILWRTTLYFEIRTQFNRLRGAGLPVSAQELNAWLSSVPDSENGALEMMQALGLLGDLPGNRSNEVMAIKIQRTNQCSLAEREVIAQYLQTNAIALQRAQEVLRLSRFRYPLDFSYGPDTELPHLGKLKKLAQILLLKAAIEADQGLTNEWPDNIVMQLRLAQTLDGEPTLISHLARNSLVRLAAKTTERSLNRASISDDACKKLETAFARVANTNSLPFALIGERAMLIPVFRMSWKEMHHASQSEDRQNVPRKRQQYSGKPMASLWFCGLFERDLNFFLKTMDDSISQAAFPAPRNLELIKFFDAVENVAQRRSYFLSGILLPSLKRAVIREATVQALVEETETALALEQFHHSENRLPDRLNECTPRFLTAVPIDPFDGAPLRYKRLSSGYVVYSVDADGKDDGGREPPERGKVNDQSTCDITFQVER